MKDITQKNNELRIRLVLGCQGNTDAIKDPNPADTYCRALNSPIA